MDSNQVTMWTAFIAAGAGLFGGIVGVVGSLLVAGRTRTTELLREKTRAKIDVARMLHENLKGAYVSILEFCWELRMGHKGQQPLANLAVPRHASLIDLLGSDRTKEHFQKFIQRYELPREDGERQKQLETAYDELRSSMREDMKEVVDIDGSK